MVILYLTFGQMLDVCPVKNWGPLAPITKHTEGEVVFDLADLRSVTCDLEL